ncbi:kynurenine aminotransferase-like isoform X3 [Apostichopus japonicus]
MPLFTHAFRLAKSSRVSHFFKPTSPYLLRYLSSTSKKMTSLKAADRLSGQPGSVWVEFIALANETKSINLGQGFPNFAPPDNIVTDLVEATTNSGPLMNQYTRAGGHPRLVKIVSEMYGEYFNRKIDPMTEVLVSVGAYGSLYYALMSHVNPGDEVIIIEPSFDSYEPVVLMAGGKPRHVPLRPARDDVESTADWKLDKAELEAAFTEKTKAIVVNSPNNPLGKVFTYEELETVADLCKKYDILCISDEVYEHMVYDGNKHLRMASCFPDMWERTITTYSAGKIFCATGWRLGWSIGPPHLIKNMMTIHQNCVFTCATPLQEAVARGLELEMSRRDTPECFFNSTVSALDAKRTKMEKWLREANLSPMVPEGGYFMLARIDDKDVDLSGFGDGPRDYKFVRYLMKTQGVATIPCSAFFGPAHKDIGEKYIRFCFIKEDETIDAAGQRLVEWSKTLQKST